jgi:hypothetical protein
MMKISYTLPCLLVGLLLSLSVQANDHKALGMIAIPRKITNDLSLKIPVCRVIKRLQLTAEYGDISLNGATIYFKTTKSSSQTINVPPSIKEGMSTNWININSDSDNKRCVSRIIFSGSTVNSSDLATLKVFGDD